MSVFFKDISTDHPVQNGDAENLLSPLGLSVKPEESTDYQPIPNTERYLRENIRRPKSEEQDFGHAWTYRFLIRGDSITDSSLVPLKGNTVCLKDCIAVTGVLPQFFGSEASTPWTPSTDATIVTRVLDAGADILGTATCEHFCNSTASFTSAQGTIENPYRQGYSTGGSKSGGAALVGSGKIDTALGTEQGGSIRVPAAFCGCVGLRTTHGLVPFEGITSGDSIDDHAGPLCQKVIEVAYCLDVISGYDDIDDKPLGAAAHGSCDYVTISLLKEVYNQQVNEYRVRDYATIAARKLESLGATGEEQRIAGSSGILGRTSGRRGLGLTQLNKARLPWSNSSFQKFFPSTKNTIIDGLYLSEKFPGLYSKTVNIGRQISDAYQKSVLGSFEPTVGLTINTAVFNVTDHPVIQVFLPVGMQVVGGLWQERKVLNDGYAWETNFDWKRIQGHGSAVQDIHKSFPAGTHLTVNERSMPELNNTALPGLKQVGLAD
ncbi:amidase [Colletotrichum falcatum]|nr:amidase [Colletotrichum falcatum]